MISVDDLKDINISEVTSSSVNWLYIVLGIFLLSFLLDPRGFFSLLRYQLKQLIDTICFSKELFHDYRKILEPNKHKNQTKSRYIEYYNGHYHAQENTFSCSCGKKYSGCWTITGLNIPVKEGREYNERQTKTN